MTSADLVKTYVSKYHLNLKDLKSHLKTLFPGEKIRAKEPENDGKYFEVKQSRKLTEEELRYIAEYVAKDPVNESW